MFGFAISSVKGARSAGQNKKHYPLIEDSMSKKLTEKAVLQELGRWTSGLPLAELNNFFNAPPEKLKEKLDRMEKKGLVVRDHIDWYEVKKEDGKEEKKGKQQVILTSFFEEGSKFYEQVYDPQQGARFAGWDEECQEPKFFESIVTDERTYLPINDDALKQGAVLLPERPEEYESLRQLACRIKKHIHRYVDVCEDFGLFSTYYILLSWVYDKVNTLPYLRVLGDTGTGKSRFLDVVGRLCYKPCIVSGAITPAPIYRMIRRWNGTIVLDEADFRDSSEKSEVITILNCGFERGRPVIRCNKDRPNELEFLPTFGPKVFSTRYTFKDKALESRCLTERMSETDRDDIPAVLPERFYREEMQLRNKLLLFRFRYRDRIDPDQEVDLGEIEPRLKQATSSFSVLFSNFPELMERFRKFLREYNQELVEERATTFEGTIVNTLFSLRKEQEDISAGDIAEKIKERCGMETRPQTVGKYLKSLNIQTRYRRTGGSGKRCILWDKCLMEKLRRRYCPQVNETAETNETLETDVSAVSNVSSVSRREDKNLQKMVEDSRGKPDEVKPSLGGRCFYHRDREATHEVPTVEGKRMKVCQECFEEWRRLKVGGKNKS